MPLNQKQTKPNQNSNITETSPSDCLVSYLGHPVEKSYPSVEKQLVYYTAAADRARIFLMNKIKITLLLTKNPATDRRDSDLHLLSQSHSWAYIWS